MKHYPDIIYREVQNPIVGTAEEELLRNIFEFKLYIKNAYEKIGLIREHQDYFRKELIGFIQSLPE